jgi:hypothetical protein
VPPSTSVPVPAFTRLPPSSSESIVAVPDDTIIEPEASEIAPPVTVASPCTLIEPTSTRPDNVSCDPAASTTLLPSTQDVGVPSASCHSPVVQSPSPDQYSVGATITVPVPVAALGRLPAISAISVPPRAFVPPR